MTENKTVEQKSAGGLKPLLLSLAIIGLCGCDDPVFHENSRTMDRYLDSTNIWLDIANGAKDDNERNMARSNAYRFNDSVHKYLGLYLAEYDSIYYIKAKNKLK